MWLYLRISQSYVLPCLSQKNPQIMYLEQELESLKAVLEIKNEKLHQQDVKLMKMEKLVGPLQSLPRENPVCETHWPLSCNRGAVVTAPAGCLKTSDGKTGSIFFSVIVQGSVIAAFRNLFPPPRNM